MPVVRAVVEFLLDRGVPAGAPLRPNEQTGLHAAALGGHAAIVRFLLGRGATAGAAEKTYDGTPLNWVLFGWSHAPAGGARDRYDEVVALLVRAGAPINPAWLDDDAEHTPFARALHADARMRAALAGRVE